MLVSFQKQDILSAVALVLVQPMKTGNHYSQPKHVVGTQKNRLNEMVLLSTQNIC